VRPSRLCRAHGRSAEGRKVRLTSRFIERISHNHRFLNMDYVIFDALRDCELQRVALTYDIWCKWSIHAEKRAHKHFPHDLTKGFLRLKRRGFIPKLHIYGHGIECRTQYSLNYHPGLGQTDRESIKRDWAAIVQAALQTGEMNAGTRHGTLDDHWADKNFCCIIGLSEYRH
jgi:hypothetical protein